MKILYHHRIASRDGQFIHVEAIVDALERRGHVPVLVGPSAVGKVEYGHTAGLIALLKRRMPRAIYEILELAYGLYDYCHVARVFKQVAPDILYERYNLHTPACALLRRRHRLPFLLEVNAPLCAERQRYGGLAWPSLARWSERMIWRSADAIVTVTGALASEIAASGVSRDKIWVLPNAIDLAAFQNLPSLDVAKEQVGLAGKRVLGFVGFVRAWHGLDRVVAWLDQGPADVVFLLVGDGPALRQLREEAHRRGVQDRFIVTGALPHEAVPKYVAAFDIALQPTVVPYASPLKMFEYMAIGRPIIAPDMANIREILTHGHDGWLIDPDQLPHAIDLLLSDKSLCERLGAEARRTIERLNLTWDNNAARIEQIVRCVLTSASA